MDKDYELYILISLNYEQKNNNDELYPSNWNNSYDYKLKNKILLEAIEKNILIKDTMSYKKSCVLNLFD